MTIREIRKAIQSHGRDISQVHLYRLFRTLDIRPAGLRQRPQQYPDDTPQRILAAWGISAPAAGSKTTNKKQLATLAELKRKAKK